MNNDLAFSPLKMENVDEIVKISTLSFPTPWSKESIIKEINDNKFARYIVAYKNDIVVGYGGFWLILDEAHITNIAVHPEYRGIGIGSAILEELINICKIEGVPSMTLEVRKSNITAQNMYIKFGFIQEGLRKNYYRDNKEDALIMWKHQII